MRDGIGEDSSMCERSSRKQVGEGETETDGVKVESSRWKEASTGRWDATALQDGMGAGTSRWDGGRHDCMRWA